MSTPITAAALEQLHTIATMHFANGGAPRCSATPTTLLKRELVARTLDNPERGGWRLQRYAITEAGWRTLAEAIRDERCRPVWGRGAWDRLERYLPAPAEAAA